VGVDVGGLVFGTLLGPEATGPSDGSQPFGLRSCLSGLFVSGFLAAPSTHFFVCGVCGLGLLFENYIVDASIFYKKQFPRIMNLDLSVCLWVCGWFLWFSRKLVFLIFCGQVFKSTRWMPWH
jgi:hypothetical protein